MLMLLCDTGDSRTCRSASSSDQSAAKMYALHPPCRRRPRSAAASICRGLACPPLASMRGSMINTSAGWRRVALVVVVVFMLSSCGCAVWREALALLAWLWSCRPAGQRPVLWARCVPGIRCTRCPGAGVLPVHLATIVVYLRSTTAGEIQEARWRHQHATG